MELKHDYLRFCGDTTSTFNRTAYGIETVYSGIYTDIITALLIAPLMELKR